MGTGSSTSTVVSKPAYFTAPPSSIPVTDCRRHIIKPAGPLVGQDGELLRPPFLRDGEPCEEQLVRSLPAGPPSSGPPEAMPDSGWLKALLNRWENPVFERTEPPVARIGSGTAVVKSDARISRDALAQALVISQVDNKFILVKACLDSGPDWLFLVDQHAADERVKLEFLMAEYFVSSSSDAISEQVETPVRFELSAPEASRLERLKPWFRHWGIGYEVERATCSLTSLPPSIHSRCLQEPRLLIDLIRRELWASHPRPCLQSQDHDHDHGHDHDHDHDHDRESNSSAAVSRRFHGCPTGILELLNSRACRTAIMFNDVLSMDECRSLIQRLTTCALPFQCAHGRPVLAPIVQLASFGEWKPADQHTGS
jgi:DNA mismatch repair protein MLH3